MNEVEYTYLKNPQDLEKVIDGVRNIVFDIEADGLLNEVSKIHCLAFEAKGEIYLLTSYGLIRKFIEEVDGLVGHNIIDYDIPAIEKVIGVKYEGNIIDTMGISWYLNTNPGSKHGLEHYGEVYGFPKVEIDDWENLYLGEYMQRCAVDVKINYLLFQDQLKYLANIYRDEKGLKKVLNYIKFKLDTLDSQKERPLQVDLYKTVGNIEILEKEISPKFETLKKVLPKVPKKVKRNKPKVLKRKDGSISAHGERWYNLLKEKGLPEDFEGPVEVITRYEEPNPGSPQQIKDWLFSIGWVPCTFEERKNTKGEINSVPQVRVEGELVESVKRLVSKEPAIEALEDMGVLSHRKTFLEGILRDVNDDGELKASAYGFTNTMRYRHRNFVNVPKVQTKYGEYIREIFVPRKEEVMIGADLSKLEDSTKMHYIFPYDPEYVKEMMTEDFDSHLDVAVAANLITKEQAEAHKRGEASFSVERDMGKQVNFSALYGIGPTALAKALGVPVREAKKLLEAFWRRNWAVEQVAKDTSVRKIGEQLWLLNPVSKLWYPLRYKKDIFSTLNQGTGVYCFDVWVAHLNNLGIFPSAQMHDEVIIYCKKGEEEEFERKMLLAMERANKDLKLNVELKVDIKFGPNYAEVH